MTRKSKANEVYGKHSNLLTSRAHSWSERTGRDFSDMLGVCEEAFMECMSVFDPGRGAKFSSLLALICNQKLGRYCKKFDVPATSLESEDGDEAEAGEEATVNSFVAWERWTAVKENLSEDTHAVVDAMLSDPSRIIEESRSMSKTKLQSAAKRVLRRSGFRPEVVEKAFADIVLRLEEARA